MFLLDRVLVMH